MTIAGVFHAPAMVHQAYRGLALFNTRAGTQRSENTNAIYITAENDMVSQW